MTCSVTCSVRRFMKSGSNWLVVGDESKAELTASLIGCGWWTTGEGRDAARDLDLLRRLGSCDRACSAAFWKERAVGVDAEFREELRGSGGSGGEGEEDEDESSILTSIR